MEWYIILIIVVSVILISYIIFTMLLFRKIFHPGSDKPLTEVDLTKTHYAPYIDMVYGYMNSMFKEKYEELYVDNNGVKLYGRFFNRNSKTTIVMVHGYRAVPYSNFSAQASYFLDHGFNVFFPYQRAHDGSMGKHITFGYKEKDDIAKWCELINEKYNTNIILYGTSMGAATVVNTAGNYHYPYIKGVVSDCGFLTSYKAISTSLKLIHVPGFLVMPVISLYAKISRFSLTKNTPIENIGKIDVPVMIIHSKLDDVITYHAAEELYKKANEPKKLVLNEIGGHTTAFMTSTDEVKEEVLNFIKKMI